MDYPLISAITPTANRRAFLEQAIKLFEAQDYPNKELIIIEDGDEYNGDRAVWTNYNYVLSSRRLSIGEKRNRACQLARGSIICQWDDDDYYGPQRLSKQVEPILRDEADVTGLKMDAVYNLLTGEAWRCGSDALHKEVFSHGVHTGTLMFRRALWGINGAMYPDKFSGEDADFLASLLERGARLRKVENEGDFVYIRHTESSWPLPPHLYPHMQDWQRVSLDELFSEQGVPVLS